MSTITREFTKEQLIEHAKYGIDRYTKAVAGFPRHMDVAMDLALARIALASLEAEASGRNPVLAYADSYRDMAKQGVESIPVWSVITDLERNIAPLFTAPPAPVSVPEHIKRNDADGWYMYKGRRGGGGCAEWYNRALDDCRASMLKGAEPVTTAYKLPEGWVACSERMPEDRESVLLWDIDLDDACSGHYSHETGNFYQSGMIIDNEITHWMPLPAAPQQEVKNG